MCASVTWSRADGHARLSRTVLDVIERLNDIPLGGVLVTAVHREGQLAGNDLFLMEDVAELCVHPVIASGGIASVTDLRELSDRGIAAAVVGMALYTGSLDARAIAEEFRRMSGLRTPLLAAVEEVARLAGDIALGYFRSQLDVESKADGSPVTIADRARSGRRATGSRSASRSTEFWERSWG